MRATEDRVWRSTRPWQRFMISRKPTSSFRWTTISCCAGPGHLRYASDFMQGRRVRTGRDNAPSATMNRLYVVETALSCTGAKADHRLAMKAAGVLAVARAIGATIGLEGVNDELVDPLAAWARRAADDLKSHAGPRRWCWPASDSRRASTCWPMRSISDWAASANRSSISSRSTLIRPSMSNRWRIWRKSSSAATSNCCSCSAATRPTRARRCAPGAALERAGNSFYLGLYENETSRRCLWHLPETHYLEAWSDARAYDGTASLVQPVIEPLTGGRSAHEVLALAAGTPHPLGRELVRAHWRKQWHEANSEDFETRWRIALHDGVIAGSAAEAKTVSLAENWQRHLAASPPALVDTGALELNLLPDPSIHDGRFANNGWLQEVPKPLTKLAWGNAAIVSPLTAKRLGLAIGDYAHGGEHGGYYMPVVELAVGEASLEAPLWIMPGHADDTVTLHLGFGRTAAGRVGGGAGETLGANAYRLRTSQHPWFAAGAALKQHARTELVACTQQHHQMAERSPVRTASLDQYHNQPDFAGAAEEHDRDDRSAHHGTLGSLRQIRLLTPQAQMGDGDRSDNLHRLQCLRRSLPGRE